MNNNLPEDLLIRPHKPSGHVAFAEERWGKRPTKKHKSAGKSHFYRAPPQMPTPGVQRAAQTTFSVPDVPGVAEEVNSRRKKKFLTDCAPTNNILCRCLQRKNMTFPNQNRPQQLKAVA